MNVKLKLAIYRVIIGCKSNDYESDNWRQMSVMAQDAQKAAKKVRLKKNEYYAEVRLVARSDK